MPGSLDGSRDSIGLSVLAAPTPLAIDRYMDPLKITPLEKWKIAVAIFVGYLSGAFTMPAAEDLLTCLRLPPSHLVSAFNMAFFWMAGAGNGTVNSGQMDLFIRYFQKKSVKKDPYRLARRTAETSGSLVFLCLALTQLQGGILREYPLLGLLFAIATASTAFAEFHLGSLNAESALKFLATEIFCDWRRAPETAETEPLVPSQIEIDDLAVLFSNLNRVLRTSSPTEQRVLADLYDCLYRITGGCFKDEPSTLIAILLTKGIPKNHPLLQPANAEKLAALQRLLRRPQISALLVQIQAKTLALKPETLSIPLRLGSIIIGFCLIAIVWSYFSHLYTNLPNLNIAGWQLGNWGYVVTAAGVPGLCLLFLLGVHFTRHLLLKSNTLNFNFIKTNFVSIAIGGVLLGLSGALLEATLGCAVGNGNLTASWILATIGLVIKGTFLNAPYSKAAVASFLIALLTKFFSGVQASLNNTQRTLESTTLRPAIEITNEVSDFLATRAEHGANSLFPNVHEWKATLVDSETQVPKAISTLVAEAPRSWTDFGKNCLLRPLVGIFFPLPPHTSNSPAPSGGSS